MLRFLGFIGGAAAIGMAGALFQDAPAPKPPPDSAVPAAAGSKRVELDVAYAADDKAQRLDFYRPEKDGYATVVFVYGGGWHSGSGRSCAPIAEKLARLGFGCALVSHRLSPPHVWPAHAEDVASAFAWTHAHVAERGGDPKRIFLVGHSSGAQLSLLLSTDESWLAAHDLSPDDVAGVVGLSPPVDLEPHQTGKSFGDTLMAGRGADAFSRDAAVMKDASPIHHLSASLPRCLLVAGENDFPMLPGDVAAFAAKAKELGADARTLITKGRDHMGVVAALLEEGSDVEKSALEFLRAGVTASGGARP